MIPIYYDGTTGLQGNGLGALRDAIYCTVTEERNGSYELEMQYPITGQHYDSLAMRGLVKAKPNPYSAAQYFRIYKISRPINGLVTINARHISYDLSGIPVIPFTANSATAALAGLKSNAADTCDFDFWTDKNILSPFTVSVPSSIRSLLGGTAGSILDTYGGEYEWDNYTVKLHARRGADRGVTIRYGKNLTDLTQEENCANVYTGIFPYWADDEGGVVQISGAPIVNVPDGQYDFTRIMTLDVSQDYDEQPTDDQLKQAALNYIKANNVGVPKVSLAVSFAQLEQTEEYKGKALLERVCLCDTVHVSFDRLGVDATARVIKTTYNVLLDRYDSVELGSAKSTLAGTVADLGKDTKTEIDRTKSILQEAIDRATQLITGNLGGYVILHSSTGGAAPDEILVMDQPDINTATKVWRWNLSGWGYSGTGYSGPYRLAATMDGAINADFITTGSLAASLVKAGVLQDKTGKVFFLDLDNGILRLNASSITQDGKELETVEDNDQKLKNHPTKSETETAINVALDGIKLGIRETDAWTDGSFGDNTWQNFVQASVSDDVLTITAVKGRYCGASLYVPDTLKALLPGRKVRVTYEYKVTQELSGATCGFIYWIYYANETSDGYYGGSTWANSTKTAAVSDWKTVTFTFTVKSDTITRMYFQPRLDSGATGQVQVRNVSLQYVSGTDNSFQLTKNGVTISSAVLNTSGYASQQDLTTLQLNYDSLQASVIKDGEVRSKFAMDTSSVTISSGVITFSGNTLVVNSDNFKLAADGTVAITGTFTSQVGRSQAYIGDGEIKMSIKDSTGNWRNTVRLWSSGTTAAMGHLTLYGNNTDGRKEERVELQAENGGGRIYVYNSGGKAILSVYPQSDGTGKLEMSGANADTGTIAAPRIETKYGLYVNGYLFHPEKVNYKNGGGTSVEQWFLAIRNDEAHP